MFALLAATAGSAGAQAQIGLNFTGRVWSPGIAPDRSVSCPDTMGAVSEQHIVELLNDGYSVYRKSDGLLERRSTLTEFWGAAGVTPVGQAFDPRILYDAANQRWFAVSIDGWTGNDPNRAIDPNKYLVAVSKSADPTQGWTGFQVDSDPTDTTWADYPQLGMDAAGLYKGARRCGFGPSGIPVPCGGQSLLVLPKADLLAASPSIANATNWSNLSPLQVGIEPKPVVNYDGTGLPATLLSGSYAFLGQLQSTKIEGSIGSPVLGPSEYIPVPATGQWPYLAAQPGPKADIWAGGTGFPGSAVQVDGSIWAAQATRVDGRVAVRWYEIDAATDIVL